MRCVCFCTRSAKRRPNQTGLKSTTPTDPACRSASVACESLRATAGEGQSSKHALNLLVIFCRIIEGRAGLALIIEAVSTQIRHRTANRLVLMSIVGVKRTIVPEESSTTVSREFGCRCGWRLGLERSPANNLI
jgi:hypothetical protein